MKTLGVINSDKRIKKIIENDILVELGDTYSLKSPETIEDAFEILNYDMPEIVIINLCDTDLKISQVLSSIKQDPWFHTFGIIGLYDKKQHKKKDLLIKLSEFNIINLLEFDDISYNLSKTIRIAEKNRQILFQKDITGKLIDSASGSFDIENDPHAVSCYSGLITICLFNKGYVDDRKKFILQFALTELIMNGIEHGNCAINSEEKARYLEEHDSIDSLILEKCKDPKIAEKRVRVEYLITSKRAVISIEDEGNGFNWRKIIEAEIDPEDYGPQGRGIWMTRSALENLTYNEKGTKATVTIKPQAKTERVTPTGFIGEVLILHPGDVVFEQGEEGSFLYYISSGEYGVYQNDKKIGLITKNDILMGEMAFLLGNHRSATVKAETEGKLIKVSKKTFIKTIKEYPHYGIFISKLLAKRLDETNKKLASSVLTFEVT